MSNHWVVDALRNEGLDVILYPGWETRSNGSLSLYHTVWHHDASAPGDSPGVPNYMIRNFKTAGANAWVSRSGAWHIISVGRSYHAGKVLAGKPGNSNSFGIETDHTTGEDWPDALLQSLRRGTAAIHRAKGLEAERLEFHKTICSPKGRKVDPDGLDLANERTILRSLIQFGGTPTPVTPPPLPKPKDYLIKGDSGPAVVNLQRLLINAGYSVGSYGADGVYGDDTVNAVAQFQRDFGLVVDGVAGVATVGKLNTGAKRPTVTAAPPFPLPNGWYFGPKSGPTHSVSGFYGHREDLRRWQQRMVDRGWPTGVDGYYGPNTEATARQFQAQKGLYVDGLIGTQTWAAAWTLPVT